MAVGGVAIPVAIAFCGRSDAMVAVAPSSALLLGQRPPHWRGAFAVFGVGFGNLDT